jgi:menaquinone-dependent protoporphyrinogen oxidase
LLELEPISFTEGGAAMNRILVAYATMAGSTADVAKAMGEEIAKSGLQVDVLPLGEVNDIQAYDGVVVGGPMIMGWHRAALRFLKTHRDAFQHIPLAVFVMAMSLTQTGETSVGNVPVYVDKNLPKPPIKDGSLNFRERYARLSNYLQPILMATRPVKPVSIGIFGGRLEYGRLKWWAVLFVMLIIQAPAGERRNWPAIQEWSAGLPGVFHLVETK